MNHADHVTLLQGGVPAGGGGIWADFGSGTGAFTLALADLIGPTGVIYSIDKDRSALAQQERLMRDRFPQTLVHYRAADFTQPIQLPPLNGLVVANALHFHRQPDRLVTQLRTYLAPGASVEAPPPFGRLVIVEYNTAQGNFAVPHPIPFVAWQALARRAGFSQTQLLARRPSRFLNEIYSALSQ